MKKKTITFVVIVILALVVFYFSIGGIQESVSGLWQQDVTPDINTGYAGLQCASLDANGICNSYINTYANSTYTIAIN